MAAATIQLSVLSLCFTVVRFMPSADCWKPASTSSYFAYSTISEREESAMRQVESANGVSTFAFFLVWRTVGE